MSQVTARDFFERARAASQDAERCRRQLQELEARARGLGSQSFEPRTRSTPDPHRMERRIVAYMDQERRLSDRMDADYRMIDLACAVLYGDGDADGLDRVQSCVMADVLWWRYLAGEDWRHVARSVGMGIRPAQIVRDAALSWMDETDFMGDVRDSSLEMGA